MALAHRMGEVQVDFGHAVGKLLGGLPKVEFFVMVFFYSDVFL